MKWIGQHIYDLASRFRNDVYLEDISTGTIASGGNLGLDSNNKIVKDDGDGVTDLHGAGVDGSNNQLLTDDGDGTVTSEANLTFDGTDLFLAGSGKMEFRDTGSYISSLGTNTLEVVTDTLYVNSSSIRLNGDGTNEPYFFMSSTVDDATGPILYFQKLRDGNGLVDGDILGKINFTGEDGAGNFENYGSITGSVMEADDGDEAGKITIHVANDGVEVNGITMTADKGTAAEVDVAIANGTNSTTTIAGNIAIVGGITSLGDRLNANLIGASGSVGNSEYGYLNGVTSSIQTQIDTKTTEAYVNAKYSTSYIPFLCDTDAFVANQYITVSGNGISNHAWNVDTDLDHTGANARTIGHADAHLTLNANHLTASIIIPQACQLMGFYAVARNEVSDTGFGFGIFHTAEANADWGNGVANVTGGNTILRAYGISPNTGNEKKHQKIDGMLATPFALAEGDLLTPAAWGPTGDQVKGTITLVLRTLIE